MMPYRTLVVCALGMTCLVAACSGDPEEAKRTHIAAGDALMQDKKYPEAIVEYRSALRVDERFAEARTKLAVAFERSRDLPRALREYVRAADLLPNDIDAQLAAARILARAGRFDEAKSRAERAIAIDARNVDAQVMLGHALAGLKDLDGAIREVEEAIELDPLEGRTYLSYGVMQLAKGDAARAEEAFTEAVKLEPRSIDARLALSTFQWLLGKAADAEQTLKTALEVDADDPRVNRALAAVYMRSGRGAEAEVHFKRVADRIGDARSRMALADYYILMRRPDAAATVLNGLTNDKDAGAAAYVKLAAIAYTDGRTDEAHRIVDGLIAKESSSIEPRLVKGRFLLAEGKVDAAIEHLKPVADREPKIAAAHYLLGQAHLARSDLTSAAAALRAATTAAPRAIQAQVQLARVLLLRSDGDASLEVARGAVRTDSSNPLARVILIDALIATRDAPGAERELAVLKKQYPDALVGHLLEGKLQMLKGNSRLARHAFGEALRLKSPLVDAEIGLLNVDLASGDVQSARRRAEGLMTATTANASVQMSAARAFAAAGEWDRAAGILTSVLRSDPDRHAARRLLGEVYASSGRVEQALRVFDELSTRDAKSASAHLAAAVLLHSLKRVDEARVRYEEVLKIEPTSGAALNNLAWILADRGVDLDRALSLAKKAADQQPDDPSVNDTIGWVYYQMRLPLLAVPAFERALKAEPNSPQFHYRLARALIAAGNPERARTHLQRALAISTTFDGVADARVQLANLAR